MNPSTATPTATHALPDILRGDTKHLQGWIQNWQTRQFAFAILTIVIGSSLYGAAVGLWRAPAQACYVALKMPLILLGTAFGNAMLNGMMAPLLGLQINFRQSLLAILMSFVIAATILGAFSPLMFFLVWNAPAFSVNGSGSVHASILLLDVFVIAFAGIAANARLLKLLRELSGSRAIAMKLFFAWIAVNLLLGSQLSWILRPFIGSPGLPVEFLRADAFHGNFYEAVFNAFKNFLR
ncbi:MAG: hypothetical protein JWM68_4096 [Verrucomicrobiales bacterium]|nr:hypothetical protein [Verrucomicrobiales bacterium]